MKIMRMKKSKYPLYLEIEVDHPHNGTSVFPTQTTKEEDEEIFEILDRRARENLWHAYVLR